MQNQLLLLAKVQEIDIQVGLIHEEERQYNADIERISEDISQHEAKLTSLKAELDELEKARRLLEDEVAVCTERIKKNEDRLKNVKNEKEFNAVTKEMNTAKKEKQTKENEIGKFNEDINEKMGFIKAGEDKLLQRKTEIEEKNTTILTNREQWQKRLKEIDEERMVIAKDISSVLLKQYETIRRKRQGIAIVAVEAGTCRGCYMNIPPQAYIQLQKGSSDLIFCPHCHRILYWRPKVSNS